MPEFAPAIRRSLVIWVMMIQLISAGEGRAMKKAFWILPCLALVMSGADVSGKWSGTIDVEDAGSTTEVKVELVQKADTLTGKVGRTGGGDEGEIRNGKVDGQKISFELLSSYSTTPFKFTLTLVNERLEGEMKGSLDQGEIVGKVKLSRATP
jgi:hypothetical protein